MLKACFKWKINKVAKLDNITVQEAEEKLLKEENLKVELELKKKKDEEEKEKL